MHPSTRSLIAFSLGLFLVGSAHAASPLIDGDLSDLAALGPPVAVSAADGPGAGPPADFGVDGTITELYARPIASGGSGPVDSLWIGLRGDFFGTSPTLNAIFLAIDVAPGTGSGVTDFAATLTDFSGALDSTISLSQVQLTPALSSGSGIGFDAVLGVTDSTCASLDACGLRVFGSDGLLGSGADFVWVSVPIAQGSSNATLPPAIGASYAAPDAIEALIPLADLGAPASVALAAFVTADDGFPSPNTLPENASDAYVASQQIEDVAVVATAEAVPALGWRARTLLILAIALLASWLATVAVRSPSLPRS